MRKAAKSTSKASSKGSNPGSKEASLEVKTAEDATMENVRKSSKTSLPKYDKAHIQKLIKSYLEAKLLKKKKIVPKKKSEDDSLSPEPKE
mmetsp:Transcript_20117/g.30881  ORF Transcript_20117/g.30881 Transcript_20117/m.30881 type:complete len:90 (+) Transcript_20117:232-501(+)|eukprot:CAMPEP_0170510626 /NCGR_PEP_ID=MMETSP0208-20121228/65871_1 /TAXON_ID=197538 /ORGANISM="Strombidium inclinatum, Strain S3" /LENGTH=89 /DNA_ID=CAMNT_0010794109 /DNA_START=589 /DNA_END=858 /DNA_ORIENTATION=+